MFTRKKSSKPLRAINMKSERLLMWSTKCFASESKDEVIHSFISSFSCSFNDSFFYVFISFSIQKIEARIMV